MGVYDANHARDRTNDKLREIRRAGNTAANRRVSTDRYAKAQADYEAYRTDGPGSSVRPPSQYDHPAYVKGWNAAQSEWVKRGQ